MSKNIFRIICLILVIIISAIIFGFSSQNGEKSGGLSKAVITKISEIINVKDSKREIFIKRGEKVVRKLAHFTIYSALGLATMGFMITLELTTLKQSIYTVIFGFLYASTDELHQLFINGRNGSFMDVILDTSGVFFGILLMIILGHIINKTRNNIEKKNVVI